MHNSHLYDAAYEGVPRWDIPRPQEAIVSLLDCGRISGPVLDLGCGTGENALLIARQGIPVIAIDFSAKAIAKARAKAVARGQTTARFVVGDVLALDEVVGTVGLDKLPPFRTAIDCCLFHVLSDEDRPRYVNALNQCLGSGVSLYLVCFSEKEPKSWGPRRIRWEEIIATFSAAFDIRAIVPTQIEHRKMIRIRDDGEPQVTAATSYAMGWLAHMIKL